MSRMKFKLVNIVFNQDHLVDTMSKLVRFQCLHLIPSDYVIESVHGADRYQIEEDVNGLLKDLKHLEESFGKCIQIDNITNLTDTLSEIQTSMDSILRSVDDLVALKSNLFSLKEKYLEALRQVEWISSLNVSLDDVFACEYLVSRVGKLPLASVSKLQYYHQKPFIFLPFSSDESVNYCMYLTSDEYEREIDNIFSSLLFKRIHIPDFVHGTPDQAKKSLNDEISFTQNEIDKAIAKINQLYSENESLLIKLKSETLLADEIRNAGKFTAKLGNHYSVSGFIFEDNAQHLAKVFTGEGVEVHILPPDSDKRLKVPKRLKKKLCDPSK